MENMALSEYNGELLIFWGEIVKLKEPKFDANILKVIYF